MASLRGAVETIVGHQAALDQLFERGSVGFDAFTRPTNTGTWLNMFICLISVEPPGMDPVPLSVGAPTYSEVCS